MRVRVAPGARTWDTGRAMEPRARDTSAEAGRVQTDLLRSAGPQRRLEVVLHLSRTVIGLARRGLHRARPEATEEEIDLLFLRVHYGDDLADRVAALLRARRGRER